MIGVLFSKKHGEMLTTEVIDTLTTQQQYETYMKLYRTAIYENLPKGLQMRLLENALVIGPKCSQYDVDLFTEFLKWKEFTSIKNEETNNMDQKQKNETFAERTRRGKDWAQCIANLPRMTIDLNLYLGHFAFKRNGDLSAFRAFSKHVLNTYQMDEIEDQTRIYLA